MNFLDDFVLLAELDDVMADPDPAPELDSWAPPPREKQTVRPGARQEAA